MKSYLFFLLLAVSAAAQSAPVSAVPAPAAASALDADWDNLQTLMVVMPNPRPKPFNHAIYAKWTEDRLRHLQTAGLAFYEQHPDDPRRWQVAAVILRDQPKFYASYNPEFEASPWEGNAVIDETARQKWEVRRAALIHEVLSSDAAGVEAHEIADVAGLKAEFAAWPVLNAERLESEVLRIARTYPEGMQLFFFVNYYGDTVEKDNPAAMKALWAKLLDTPNTKLREVAKGMQRLEQGKSTPVDLKFTALDGREVDLAKLRGKVVLIDFWATWCGPCVAEMPNVKKVYSSYHDRGFEVVGISLDDENSRPRLEAFLKKHDLPWPQYYDGKGWQTDLAVAYAVSGIPAMLLLDKDGRIVSTQARGEALEIAVKKYLGL